MMDTTETAGTEFIKPMAVPLSIDGADGVVVDMVITPVVLEEIPGALALVMPLFASLKVGGPGYIDRMADGTLTADEMSALLMSIVVSGEDYMSLLALFSRRPLAWVKRLLPDRGIKLALVCCQVNADFFRKAMPQMRAMASLAKEQAAALSRSATPMPSSNS